ncbi:hypothetical protein [Salinisphaera hydrothermalis]|uniref:Uncharacterized protein n=1 Tax=Salinisphaera hydrothermalis (strain C41B8) TaxID=1304275 RepID=A0A084IJW2_SALHC|nr:hypothetical protein [Salinisphaera hydrothermalis]KEZ76996.1 hypothetical protein C41B8_12410 [Salinisphaera hydrothermalis C41B8]
MARSWLEVTTGEVQSRLETNDRLSERREAMAEQAWSMIDGWVAEVFQSAAERIGRREFRVAGDSEYAVARCGIYAPGAVEHDPRVAFHEAEFDGYQPLVVLRRKAEGAGAPVQTRTLRVSALDEAALTEFLNG